MPGRRRRDETVARSGHRLAALTLPLPPGRIRRADAPDARDRAERSPRHARPSPISATSMPVAGRIRARYADVASRFRPQAPPSTTAPTLHPGRFAKIPASALTAPSRSGTADRGGAARLDGCVTRGRQMEDRARFRTIPACRCREPAAPARRRFGRRTRTSTARPSSLPAAGSVSRAGRARLCLRAADSRRRRAHRLRCPRTVLSRCRSAAAFPPSPRHAARVRARRRSRGPGGNRPAADRRADHRAGPRVTVGPARDQPRRRRPIPDPEPITIPPHADDHDHRQTTPRASYLTTALRCGDVARADLPAP